MAKPSKDASNTIAVRVFVPMFIPYINDMFVPAAQLHEARSPFFWLAKRENTIPLFQYICVSCGDAEIQSR